MPAVEPTTLRLTTIGRTTGLPHVVIVRFVFSEGAYFVIGGGRKSDWLLNALAGKSGKVRLGGNVQNVACEPFFDEDLVRRPLTKKYGSAIVKEWYSDHETRSLKLTPKAPAVSPERPRRVLWVQETG
jgi:hypothetical protein